MAAHTCREHAPFSMKTARVLSSTRILKLKHFSGGSADVFSTSSVSFAKGWRDSLREQAFPKMSARAMFPNGKPKTLAEVKDLAEQYVQHGDGRTFLSCLDILDVPSANRGLIFERWLAGGAPAISEFAPYAAYVADSTPVLFNWRLRSTSSPVTAPVTTPISPTCITCRSAWCSRRTISCTCRRCLCS